MRLRVLLVLLLSCAPASAQASSVPVGTGTGLNAEIGTLGGSGSPMLSGRYFSLDGAKEGSGRYFDWSLEGRASAADLSTRWADPEASRSEQLYFYGLMGRVGRAYPLWGPLDVGWSLLGVARLDALFPTLSLDQTVGVRARLGGEQSVGVFGGVTEGAAALTRDWAARALTNDHPAQARVVESPHVELGAWGPIPSTSGSYQAFAGVQRNEFTTQTRLEGALSRPVLGGTVSAGLRAEDERGADMEFDRRERALRLGLDRGDGWEWSVEAGKRDVDFGGARFDGNFVSLGVTIRERTKGSVTFRGTRSSGEVATPRGPWSHIQGEVRDAAVALDALLARIPPALAGVDPARAAADLRAAYEGLPPEVRAAVAAELGGAPDFDRLAREFADARPGAIAEAGSERARLARLLNELSDPERLDRVVTRGLRVELYRALERTQFRLWGRDVSLTPGLLAAMVHAYGTGSGFVPPASAKTFDPALDRWVAERVGERLGVSCGGADVTACALAQLPPELRARLAGLPEAEARRVVAETLA
ncbi:MAG: hypothetical protein HY079_04505, partial [Elusimicrobia bacterium]|nr:hypothetical protein [Elusimicrobiota bacterium]